MRTCTKSLIRCLAMCLTAALLLGLCACGGGAEPGSPDFYVVFGCTVIPDSAAQAALETYIAGIVGDLNGDGQTVVTVEYIGISNDSNTVTDSGRLTVLLSEGEDQYTLFLLSDEPNEDFSGISSNFCSQEYFEDLSRYGVTPDPDESQRVTITGCEILTQMGLGDIDFYAQVIDRNRETDMNAAIKVIQSLAG